MEDRRDDYPHRHWRPGRSQSDNLQLRQRRQICQRDDPYTCVYRKTDATTKLVIDEDFHFLVVVTNIGKEVMEEIGQLIQLLITRITIFIDVEDLMYHGCTYS